MGGCIAPLCPESREIGAVFCAVHMLAPAAQRGGWLSAHQRRRKFQAAPKEPDMDMSNIAPRLWVGGKPPFDRDLPDFDVLVLCAQEHQPTVLGFQRQIVRVPLPDSVLTTDQQRAALIGGRKVGEALGAGRRVLVTCHAGLNRSALVASLGLGMATRMTPAQIVALMRTRRTPGVPLEHGALHNPYFVQLIEQFVGQRQSADRTSVAQSQRRRAR